MWIKKNLLLFHDYFRNSFKELIIKLNPSNGNYWYVLCDRDIKFERAGRLRKICRDKCRARSANHRVRRSAIANSRFQIK